MRKAKVDDTFEVLENINDNAHKIDLPWEYGVSCSLNVWKDDHFKNLMVNYLQQGKDDTPMEDHDDKYVHEIAKSKDLQ